MKLTRVFAALLLLPAALQTALADEPALPSLDLYYDASWGSMDVGQVQITLRPDGAAGCYRYTNTSHPTALVRLLYGSPDQVSQFCLSGGRIRTRRFESVLPGDDRQSYTLDFDWDKHTVTDNRGQARAIPDDAIDSFALQQAVRLWVQAHASDKAPPLAEFTMVDNKNLTHYKFRFGGAAPVDTPAGHFDALLMERIDNPDKLGRFWLAPARDYMPVRTETRNGNKPMVTMVLSR
ncbi:MAG: DUF3108 domain-containing protein [Nevskia sp.]|nr:DUF3108 domain-containing protein [Nevskia sp.]